MSYQCHTSLCMWTRVGYYAFQGREKKRGPCFGEGLRRTVEAVGERNPSHYFQIIWPDSRLRIQQKEILTTDWNCTNQYQALFKKHIISIWGVPLIYSCIKNSALKSQYIQISESEFPLSINEAVYLVK